MTDKLEGSAIPKVTLEATQGGKVTLPDTFKGKWTVLYFYPKDDTPGCTKQACAYRDNISKFRDKGVEVVGVSLDGMDSHGKFQSKFSLNFPLLADVNHELSEKLGVYGDQTWQGKTYKGLSRDTFLVDPTGKIRKVWRKVNAEATMEETLQAALGFMKK